MVGRCGSNRPLPATRPRRSSPRRSRSSPGRWTPRPTRPHRRTPSTAPVSTCCRPRPRRRSPATTGSCWSSVRPAPARPACSPPPPTTSTDHGREVFGVAPTAKAARTLERDTGIRSDTVAKLLHEWQRTDRPPARRVPAAGRRDAHRRRGRDAVDTRPPPARQPRRPQRVAARPRRRPPPAARRRPRRPARRAVRQRPRRATRTAAPLHPPLGSRRVAAAAMRRPRRLRRLRGPRPDHPRHPRRAPRPHGRHLDRPATTRDVQSPSSRRPTTTSTPSTAPSNKPASTPDTSTRTLRHGSPAASTPTSATSSRPAATTATSPPPPVNRSATANCGPSPQPTPTGRSPCRITADTATSPCRPTTSRAHVRLGYAATEHGWQSDTVDTAIALTSPATTRRGLYVAATRASDENVICVITDSDDVAEARDVLEGIVALDRADVPAVTQRHTLAQQTRHQQAAAAPASPRCPIPEWFPPLLADAHAEVARLEQREAERQRPTGPARSSRRIRQPHVPHRRARHARPIATNSGSQSDGSTRLDGTTPPPNANSTPHPAVPAAPPGATSTKPNGSSTGPPATSNGSVNALRQASTATNTPSQTAPTPPGTSTSMTRPANSTHSPTSSRTPAVASPHSTAGNAGRTATTSHRKNFHDAVEVLTATRSCERESDTTLGRQMIHDAGLIHHAGLTMVVQTELPSSPSSSTGPWTSSSDSPPTAVEPRLACQVAASMKEAATCAFLYSDVL